MNASKLKTTIQAIFLVGFGAATIGCSSGLAKREAPQYQQETRELLLGQNSRVQSCYDQELARNPEASGTVEVKFVVEAETGQISNPELVEEKTTAPASLGSCVLRALNGLALDPPDANPGHASFTWNFQPKPQA